MLSVLDGISSVTVTTLAVCVVAASVWRRSVRRYLFANLFVAMMLLGDGIRYAVLYSFGFRSPEYLYTFIATDALMVAATYLLLVGFFDVIFRETALRAQVRTALFAFVVIIGVVSWAMIARGLPNFYSHLIVEFQQNMYFGALILTVLVWISLTHLRIEDRQMALMVAGLGLCLSTQAGNYAFHNLLSREVFESLSFIMRRVHVLSTALQLGIWCYAIGYAQAGAPVPARAAELLPAEAQGGV